MAKINEIYVIKGIQKWDFKSKEGTQVKGGRIYLEHVPAKQGTIGSSYQEVSLSEKYLDQLIIDYGGEQNLLGLEIVEIYYNGYKNNPKVIGFKFN